MDKDCTVEEVLSNELDRLREDYIIAYNNSKPVTDIGQSMANIVTAIVQDLQIIKQTLGLREDE